MMTNLKKVFISSKSIRLISMPASGGLFYSNFLHKEEFPIIQEKSRHIRRYDGLSFLINPERKASMQDVLLS